MSAKTDCTPSPNKSLADNPYASASGRTDPGYVSGTDPKLRPHHAMDAVPEVNDSNISMSALLARLSDALLSNIMKERETFLTDKEVAARYSLSKQTIWRWTAERPAFPKPIRFENGTTRWRMSDLIAYEAAVMGAQE